ncbi:MAG: acyltransferase [Candidatus Aminicenantales bacterium]
MTKKGNKDARLETLRGLAILLVVAFHVNVWAPSRAPGLYEGLIYIFGFIRMPLFACISGYVYALRPLVPGNGWKFMRGKARRLLLPMVCVGILLFLLKHTPPYVAPPTKILRSWKILVFPVSQFWFLQALFLIFVIIGLLESAKWLDRKWQWLVALSLTLLPIFLAKPGAFASVRWPLSLDGLLSLLPYFLFGLGLCRFKQLWQSPWISAIAAALAAVGLSLQILILLGRLKIPGDKGTLFYLSLSLTYIFLLFKINWKTGWPAWLGSFSYSIFLFHVYAIMGINIILSASSLTLAPAWHYGILLVSGLALPILAHILLRPFTLTRRLFLGLR